MAQSYWWGVAAIALLIGITMVVAGTTNPLKAIGKLAAGADGRLSTSKFQWALWTGAIIFSYVVLFAIRFQRGIGGAISDIPGSVLLALGISSGTMAVAKGITTAQVSGGSIAKPPKSGKSGPSAGHLLQDDSGEVDLSKVQLLAWTVIAVVVYLFAVGHLVRVIDGLNAKQCAGAAAPTGCQASLPDIDQALVVLMGLGHAAYVGKKLVSAGTPTLTKLSKETAKPGTTVLVTGTSLGGKDQGSVVSFDGTPIEGIVDHWADKQIKFEVPQKDSKDRDWPTDGREVEVGVIVNGNPGANTLPLKIIKGS